MNAQANFQLPDEYARTFPTRSSRGPHGESASMKAAANPDPRVLCAVLALRRDPGNTTQEESKDIYVPSEELNDTFGSNSVIDWPGQIGQDPINTPLLQATRSQLLQNINLLLEAGANPNGIDIQSLESAQALFLRFRPRLPDYVDIDGDVADRKTILDCINLSQNAAITTEEIKQRSGAHTPFWMLANVVPIDIYPKGDEMHSLIAAARQPSTQILDRLVEAGADMSSWVSSLEFDPKSPTPSGLAITSPLHAAVEVGNENMIKHLLSRGFNTNFIPLSNPLSCLSPLMSTLLISEPKSEADIEMENTASIPKLPTTFNLSAYTALSTHPSTSLTLSSPIISIHPFHLASAHVSLPLFQHIVATLPISPNYIPSTALGHTILHIACLPPSASHIKTGSVGVNLSILDTREITYPRCRPSRPRSLSGNSPIPTNKELSIYFPSQTELLNFFITELGMKVSEQDTYGNTALHYLASHSLVNTSAVELLHSAEDGERTWREVKNDWGYTAEALMNESEVQISTGWSKNQVSDEIEEWWQRKLAVEEGKKRDCSARGVRGRGRGRGVGRGGDRCGECGKKNNWQELEKFPYHVPAKF